MGERGISLIEVLCVLVVVSLLAGVSFSVGAETLDNYRLEKAAKILVSDLSEARERAITENLWQEVKFFPATNMYRIIKGGVRETDVQLEQGIELKSGVLDIFFYATGAPSEGATITLANKRGRQIKVVVAAVTGRVRTAA